MMQEEIITEKELNQEIEDELENDKVFQFKLQKREHFQNYYKKCFPYKKIFKWLSYGRTQKKDTAPPESEYFNRREISYMIPSMTDSSEEFCVRHRCYKNAELFRKDVESNNPNRIDIGPVCDMIPSKNQDTTTLKAEAIEREFVIDIDMNDYDGIRTCCKDKKVCESCWKYLTAAYEVLKEALEKDFGFRHILWVFSGRRGIHLWVCDERARIMENDCRKGVTSYLNITVSSDKINSLVQSSVHSNPNYRLFVRSFEILKKKFEDFMVKEQAFFAYKKNVSKVLSVMTRLITNDKNAMNEVKKLEKLNKDLEKILTNKLKNFDENKKRNPKGKNCEIESEVSSEIFSKMIKFLDSDPIFEDVKSQFMKEIVIGLMYPKIDFHVSAQTNHLLKCPFNIHSSTGMISVPIDDFSNFSISDVPYVQDVNVYFDKNGKHIENFQRFLNHFDRFCEKLLEDELLFDRSEGAMEEENIELIDF